MVMVGGDGPHSYAKNSQMQEEVVNGAKELVSGAIADKLDLKILRFDASNKFGIVDMGCSVGPNTFVAVENIIEAVELKYQAEHNNSSPLEYQVFFNDNSDNDFNHLFRTLPPSRKYFATGVPGSFHGRLFPKSSVHVFHISSALHWLSKVPEEIVDSKSPAWNKGSIQCTGLVKEVTEAYSAQFKNDTESFLNARAQELVPGGLMLVLIATLPNGVPLSETLKGKHYDLLGSCLIDMAKMGLISEEKVDSFNFPIYYPSAEELEALIRNHGSFSIEKMDNFTLPMKNMALSVQFGTSHIRAVYEGLIKEHFGSKIVDQIFNYYTAKLAENVFAIMEEESCDRVESFFLLKRIIS